MYKNSLIFAISLFAISQAWTQDAIREKEVPQEIRDDFQMRFGEAEDITWLKQGESYYGARFTLEGDLAEAVYTQEGLWIQSEEAIAYREMPGEARNYCRSNYPDYEAGDVKKVSTRKYGILYEIRITGQRKRIGMTFDMHGKLVEEKEEEIEIEEKPKGIKGKIGKLFKRN